MVKNKSIKITCPKCLHKMDVSEEVNVVFNCVYCGETLVFKDYEGFQNLLPKGIPIELDGRHVI